MMTFGNFGWSMTVIYTLGAMARTVCAMMGPIKNNREKNQPVLAFYITIFKSTTYVLQTIIILYY